MFFCLFLFLCNNVSADLQKDLASMSPPKDNEILIQPTAYDVQIQLPLSQVSDPNTPLFTAHVVTQFILHADVGLASPFVSDDVNKGARIDFEINGLDHFENVSLVYNDTEINIANVVLTDTKMEVIVSQPILFAGRYTLSVGRYKGAVGNAIYFRDAGEHAVFGTAIFPTKASALFPVVHSLTNRVAMSVAIVHPLGTLALSSASSEKTTPVDDNWQMTTFRPTVAIAPVMLSIALLPTEYSMLENSYTGITLAVYFNRFRVQEGQAKQLLNVATQVLGLLKQFFSSSLAMAKLDLVLINDVQSSNSFGTIIVPEFRYLTFDYTNQVFHLAKWTARHWIGGLVASKSTEQLCLQEDLLSYIAFKVVKRMTNDEYLRLAHYVQVELTESIFEPGLSLLLKNETDEGQINAICGLKGVIMLDSLETLLGEQEMFTSINALVFHSRSSSIDISSFASTINRKIDDVIDISQVFLFWRHHGGFPALDVIRKDGSLRLKQRDDGATIVVGSNWERMKLWPLVLDFTEFKLPVKLMMSKGIHLSPVRDTVSLANLGFHHFYRVNYDMDSWTSILHALAENSTSYTILEKAQLTSDFCNFYALGTMPEPGATKLRDEWMRVIQMKRNAFPLCEATTLRCVLGKSFLSSLPPSLAQSLRKRLFDSMTNNAEMTCGQGAAHDSVNQLCLELQGKSCF